MAFSQKKSQTLWLLRAFDPVKRRVLPWVLGNRNDATLQKLLDKIGLKGRTFLTDDWEGFIGSFPKTNSSRAKT
ncbi:MAG: IS1 family transposase [Candidatus Competibacter sp.]|nr:IS1 family transposase [Candidatus Competibacter sp.]